MPGTIRKLTGRWETPFTTRLKAVYEYAQPVTAKGFVFMDTPGYDPVSATGQVAGGANILCFTTGQENCRDTISSGVGARLVTTLNSFGRA